MFERYTERARRVLFFARYEASQLGSISIETEHLLLGSDSRRQGPDEPDLCPIPPVPRKHPQRNRRPHGLPREGVDLGRDPVQRRNQARAAVRRRRGRSAAAQLHRHRAPAARHPARRALGGRDHPDGKGDAPPPGARRHRPAAEREDDADARQGNAAARGVQPRPDRSGDEEPARSAGRPRLRARTRAAGAVPPHQEQRGADRRARRRQDRDRRRPGAEDRLRRRAALPRRQAHARARHLADRRRHEVSRPVRRAPQGDHEGADRQPEHHRVHRRAAHAGGRGLGGRLARRRQHPEAGAVARRDPLHRRDDARGVSQVHREGSLARAPLPGDQGRSAVGERDHLDPDGRQGSLRAVPSRRIHARGGRSRGLPVEPLHHRSLPARQGDRSRRRSRRARQAARGRLQRGVRRDQQEHPRRRRADGERGLGQGLRQGAVLSRAGAGGAREPAVRPREVRRALERAQGGRVARGDRRGRLEVDRRAARRRSTRTKATS